MSGLHCLVIVRILLSAFRENPPTCYLITLDIWSVSYPPALLSAHTGMPSARILSSWFSQNPFLPLIFPSYKFSSTDPSSPCYLAINPHLSMLYSELNLVLCEVFLSYCKSSWIKWFDLFNYCLALFFFNTWWNYSVWYRNGGYMTLCIPLTVQHKE